MKRVIIGIVLSIIMFAFPALGQEQSPSRQALEAFYNDYLMAANKAFDHPTQELQGLHLGLHRLSGNHQHEFYETDCPLSSLSFPDWEDHPQDYQFFR